MLLFLRDPVKVAFLLLSTAAVTSWLHRSFSSFSLNDHRNDHDVFASRRRRRRRLLDESFVDRVLRVGSRYRSHFVEEEEENASPPPIGFFSRSVPVPKVSGLNDLLRDVRLEVGAMDGKRVDLGGWAGSVILNDFACDALEMEDLDHDEVLVDSARGDKATMEIEVKEMRIGCTSDYEYDPEKWWLPGTSGTMDLDLSSSFDLRVGLATAGGRSFEDALPERASILSCTSDTRLGVRFRGGVVQKMLDFVLRPLQKLLGGSLKNMLCENVEAGGAAALTEMLQAIKEKMEPYFDGTNDLARVDRTKPQRELDEMLSSATSSALVADYTDRSNFRLDFSDFGSFTDTFRNLSEDVCDMLKKIWDKREAAKNDRRLFVSMSAILSTVFGATASAGLSALLGTITKAITDVLAGLVKELVGSPEDVVQVVLDFLLDIIRGDDDDVDKTTDAPTAAPSAATKGRRVAASSNGDGGRGWSLDLVSALFAPDEIPVVQNDSVRFSVRRAALSGAPVRDFLLRPAAAQTLDAAVGTDRVDAAVDLSFTTAPLRRVAINEAGTLRLTMPSRALDLTISTGLLGVALDASVLAAVPATGILSNNNNENMALTLEDATVLACGFFPQFRPTFLKVVVEGLVDPVVNDFLGVGFDEAISGFLSQLTALYRSVLDDVVANFFGTTFLEKLDETVQDLLQEAEKGFTDVCETQPDRVRRRRTTTTTKSRRLVGDAKRSS